MKFLKPSRNFTSLQKAVQCSVKVSLVQAEVVEASGTELTDCGFNRAGRQQYSSSRCSQFQSQ